MTARIQAIRGMNDILPDATPRWQQLEAIVRDTLGSYGYGEIRLPLLERTELFSRSVGEHTDIVEKEMYTFDDRGGESVTLRPEGTAGCVRAALEHGLLHNQRQRLWYAGPMFRYEKPQAGRYRQFHQVGAEAMGFEGPDVDVELLLASRRIFERAGVTGLHLELNSLGTPAARADYRARLVAYFDARRDALDEDSLRRLAGNPLRILDSKNPAMQDVIAGAPAITDFLDDASAEHFAGVCAALDAADVAYTVNPRLVRGLDYYTRTTFEWLTDALGAQGAVCAGGRYDGLVELIGGRAVPAVGWAMGLERTVALMERGAVAAPAVAPHVYLVAVGVAAERAGAVLAERLRDALPALRLTVHCGGGGFKAQFKAADRSGARAALILGEHEVAAQRAGLKSLRDDAPQRDMAWDELAEAIRSLAS
jgi:histidyl-tRNA synthetase